MQANRYPCRHPGSNHRHTRAGCVWVAYLDRTDGTPITNSLLRKTQTPRSAIGLTAGLLVAMAIALLIIFFVGFGLWFLLADADLTLLWKHYTSSRSRLRSDYAGKLVWITGASSGIGEKVAYAFADLGSQLALSGTKTDVLTKVKQECLSRGAPRVVCVPFDISDYEVHEEVFRTVLRELGGLDVFVNNAGCLQRAELVATSVAVENLLFSVNVFGVINLCKLAVKHWLEKSNRNAQLFVTSSAAGKMGSPLSAAYAGSKHALHGYLESLRAELCCAEAGVSITIGCPGPVKSNLRTNALTNKLGERYGKSDASSRRKLMEASRCAELILTAISHRLDEVWIAQQPILALLYITQYFPSVYRSYLIHYIMTRRTIEKYRKDE